MIQSIVPFNLIGSANGGQNNFTLIGEHMNLRDLRYIVAVADFGHFGRAAEACNVSQPTLSGQIRKLEEELGLAIFERVGHTVRPTAPGGQILDHARRALAAAEDIVSVAASATRSAGRARCISASSRRLGPI